jgi:hypothetical protein
MRHQSRRRIREIQHGCKGAMFREIDWKARRGLDVWRRRLLSPPRHFPEVRRRRSRIAHVATDLPALLALVRYRPRPDRNNGDLPQPPRHSCLPTLPRSRHDNARSAQPRVRRRLWSVGRLGSSFRGCVMPRPRACGTQLPRPGLTNLYFAISNSLNSQRAKCARQN